MTEAPIDSKNPEVPLVYVEENYDGDTKEGAKASKINESNNEMEVDLEEKQNTEAYKVTLNIKIENIFKIENIYNHHERHCITIY